MGWLLGAVFEWSVKNTLKHAWRIPVEDRRHALVTEILNAMKEVSEAHALPHSGYVISLQHAVQRARANRHMAIYLGARSQTNPIWNATALAEDLLMAHGLCATGRISRKRRDRIENAVCELFNRSADSENQRCLRELRSSRVS